MIRTEHISGGGGIPFQRQPHVWSHSAEDACIITCIKEKTCKPDGHQGYMYSTARQGLFLFIISVEETK